MKLMSSGLAFLVAAFVVTLLSCGGDDPHPPGNDVFTVQAACRAHLADPPAMNGSLGVFVDVNVVDGVDTYVVTVKNDASGWSVLPGSLGDALLAAYAEGRKADKPVRIVYGPGLKALSDAASVAPKSALEAKQTYYATLAVGCTETVSGSHQSSPGDCIPGGADECRVQLLDACADGTVSEDGGTTAFLDIAFASWPKAVEATEPATVCYGVNASGEYAISLPASALCQCGLDSDALHGLYNDASLLLDTTLEIRGIDKATAQAIATGMTAAALSKLDESK